MASSLPVQRRLLCHWKPSSVTPWLQLHPCRNSNSNLTVTSTRTYSSHHHSAAKSHLRSSSAAQPTAKSVIPSISSTSTTSLANDVNPPPSTRPADLDLPAVLPTSAPPGDKLKRYVALGRAYLSFYKTGLKNVYHNYRTSLPLRRSLGLISYLPTSPPPKSKPASVAFATALKKTDISRSNFQLIRRAAYDVRRMIPFSVILIVCGEMTPLAVLFFGNAVTPFTCRVPKQIEKERAKKIAGKKGAMSAHATVVDGSVTGPAPGSEGEMEILARCFGARDWIEKADKDQVLRACAALGLVKSHTSPAWLVGPVYRSRLTRYAEYLELDDGLIRKCGGVKGMDGVEVSIAVEERGGVGFVEGLEGWEAERTQRRWLERWLEMRS